MATRGFEFAYMLDGSPATPVMRDFVLGVAGDHLVGDLMVVKSDGFIDVVTNTTTEVTCVIMEQVLTADVTAETTKAKCAILTRNQVWRCSTGAALAATALVGTVKTWDTTDKNTIGATDITGGAMIVAEGEPGADDITSHFDEEGYVIGYVTFSDTTFGNA